jgi:hypothetical protein
MTQEEIYEIVNEALENSTEVWETIDEEDDPELYSYWQGRVTVLEEIIDQITP